MRLIVTYDCLLVNGKLFSLTYVVGKLKGRGMDLHARLSRPLVNKRTPCREHRRHRPKTLELLQLMVETRMPSFLMLTVPTVRI